MEQKVKCLQKSGYYVYFECIESAVNLGYRKIDIIYSVMNNVTVNGLKWFFVDKNYFKCISQTDGFGKCENQCEHCKSEQKQINN